MILSGCLSILSGVVTAALHHHDKSKPVPQHLRKLFRINHLTSSSTNSSPRLKVALEENDASASIMGTYGHHPTQKDRSGNIDEEIFGKEDRLRMPYPDDKPRMANQEDKIDDVKNFSAEWKKLSGSINMLLFVVSSVLIVASVTTLYVNFFMNKV